MNSSILGPSVRRWSSYLVVVSSLIAALALLCSCNGANGVPAAAGDPPARVLSVTVSPAGASLPLGESQQFVATATLSDGSILDVTMLANWNSSNPSVAAISVNGLVTAASQGATSISAKYRLVAGSTNLTVTTAALVSITVAPSNSSIAAGQTQQFTATGTYSDSSTQNLTNAVSWSSSNTAAATIGSAGLASALKPGTTTISAMQGSVTGSTTLTVTAATLVSIAVTPANPSIPKGTTQQFTATGTFSDTSTQNLTNSVTWTSLSATVASSSTAGLATAAGTGSATIQATSGSVTGSTTLTVTVATLVSIAVTPANPSIPKGTTQQFSATGTFSDTSTQNLTSSVTWTSLNTTVATINAAGLATVVGTGSASIQATSGSITGSTTLTVTAAVVVSVSPTTASVQAGPGTQQFTATVTNDTQNGGVTWSLSCTGTCGTLSATSSASGLAITYTAPSSVPASTVTLTATSVTDGTQSASATITVTSGQLSVSVSPKRAAVTIWQQQQFVATVVNDPLNQGVNWQVDGLPGGSSTVGTIDATGKYTPPSNAGPHLVTAVAVANSTVAGTASIAVTDLAGVLTYHNDLARDGVNGQEYALAPSNVNTSTFGKLFSCSADGAIYTQPLWVPNVSINGAKRNVIVVATQHDSVYAFDADANPCVQLWHANLLDGTHGATTGETSVPSGTTGSLVGTGAGDINPEVGVTGTAVIDPSSNTIYVVSKSVDSSQVNFYQRLHGLDLATGSEKLNGNQPAVISATVDGTGDGSSAGQLAFNPRTQNQRPGLALVNGVVYISWASHEDANPYHGWVIGYNASNLAQAPGAVFNATPNGRQAGIWMSGNALAADAGGNVYCATGNGTFDADTGGTDFGDTVLKLGTASGLTVADWFTPSNQALLDSTDDDLGSSGAVVLPDQSSGGPIHLLLNGSKRGIVFLLNRDNMGAFNATTDQVIQQFVATTVQGFYSSVAFWNNTMYLGAAGDYIKAWPFNYTTAGKFDAAPSSRSNSWYGFPGMTPSVSSTPTQANGILWAIDSSTYGPPSSAGTGPAVLHAYDATNLAIELWNSSQAAGGRDTAGDAVKFTVPTVANGKVYVGTRGNYTTVLGEVDVYGLLPN